MLRVSIALFCIMLFFGLCVYRGVASIQFDRHCGGYLKRAADANTCELAKQNLVRAILYANENRLTSGYTSVVYRTPDEDVGFWYTNLTASMTELDAVRPDATQLERSNVLMKLRETLLDQGGERVEGPCRQASPYTPQTYSSRGLCAALDY